MDLLWSTEVVEWDPVVAEGDYLTVTVGKLGGGIPGSVGYGNDGR